MQHFKYMTPVVYIDSTGEFPLLISLGIIFSIGALFGVDGTFIGDVVNAVATGEWTCSSWETYASAAGGNGFVVGAAIGGVTQISMNILTGNKWNDDLSGAVICGGVAGLLTASGAGFLSMSIYTGLATSTGNQLQNNGFNPNDWNMAEFATEVFITGLLAGVGSAYGSKQIGASAKQVKNWFKPKYFSTMVSGKFMKKIT